MEEKKIDEILEEIDETPVEEPEEEVKEEKEEKEVKKDKKEDKKLKSKVASLEKELEEAKANTAETEDKYLRVAAEYENFRRRSQKEKEGVFSDAVADTVSNLLPLFDNLDRAAAFEDSEQLAEGFKMILKTVPDILGRMNITSFGEVGETFDPNIHNAIMHEESEEFGENEISLVFQKGYKVGDKIIRHAMVKVAN